MTTFKEYLAPFTLYTKPIFINLPTTVIKSEDSDKLIENYYLEQLFYTNSVANKLGSTKIKTHTTTNKKKVENSITKSLCDNKSVKQISSEGICKGTKEEEKVLKEKIVESTTKYHKKHHSSTVPNYEDELDAINKVDIGTSFLNGNEIKPKESKIKKKKCRKSSKQPYKEDGTEIIEPEKIHTTETLSEKNSEKFEENLKSEDEEQTNEKIDKNDLIPINLEEEIPDDSAGIKVDDLQTKDYLDYEEAKDMNGDTELFKIGKIESFDPLEDGSEQNEEKNSDESVGNLEDLADTYSMGENIGEIHFSYPKDSPAEKEADIINSIEQLNKSEHAKYEENNNEISQNLLDTEIEADYTDDDTVELEEDKLQPDEQKSFDEILEKTSEERRQLGIEESGSKNFNKRETKLNIRYNHDLPKRSHYRTVVKKFAPSKELRQSVPFKKKRKLRKVNKNKPKLNRKTTKKVMTTKKAMVPKKPISHTKGLDQIQIAIKEKTTKNWKDYEYDCFLAKMTIKTNATRTSKPIIKTLKPTNIKPNKTARPYTKILPHTRMRTKKISTTEYSEDIDYLDFKATTGDYEETLINSEEITSNEIQTEVSENQKETTELETMVETNDYFTEENLATEGPIIEIENSISENPITEPEILITSEHSIIETENEATSEHLPISISEFWTTSEHITTKSAHITTSEHSTTSEHVKTDGLTTEAEKLFTEAVKTKLTENQITVETLNHTIQKIPESTTVIILEGTTAQVLTSSFESFEEEQIKKELHIYTKDISITKNCNTSDFKLHHHCICYMKTAMKDLIDDLKDINSSRIYDYDCSNYLRIEPGIVIGNKSESKVHRRRRASKYVEDLFKNGVLHYGKSIDVFLEEDLIYENDEFHTYVVPGMSVTIPCFTGHGIPKKVTYNWTLDNDVPVTVGKVQDDYSLKIGSIAAQDSGNYSCSEFKISNGTNEEETEESTNEITVVAIPIYALSFSVSFNVSGDCQSGDLEILNLYYSSFVQNLLCNNDKKICGVTIEDAECGYVNQMAIVSFRILVTIESLTQIIPDLHHNCTLRCQSIVYSMITELLLKDLQSVGELPGFHIGQLTYTHWHIIMKIQPIQKYLHYFLHAQLGLEWAKILNFVLPVLLILTMLEIVRSALNVLPEHINHQEDLDHVFLVPLRYKTKIAFYL